MSYTTITRTVPVVFDMESGDTPVPLGTYDGYDEELIIYARPTGGYGQALSDCVQVVYVEVPCVA